METLNGKQFATILIIITYCALYALLGTFPMITFATMQLSPFFYISFGIFIVFYILLLTSVLFQKIGKFKHKSTDWLKLHLTFDWLQIAFTALFSVILAISFSVTYPTADLNLRLVYLIWCTSFMVGTSPYFNRIKNTLGMEYRKIGSASVNGALAFAELARLKLKNKKPEGLRYLMVSSTMLRDYVDHDRKQIRNLDEVISTIDTISHYGDNIPYNRLGFLSEALCQLPDFEEIPKALNEFLESKEVRWAQDFVEKHQRREREKLSLYIEKYIIPFALVTVTIFAAFPEHLRMEIVDTLKQAGWIQILGFFTFMFLVYVLVSFFFENG